MRAVVAIKARNASVCYSAACVLPVGREITEIDPQEPQLCHLELGLGLASVVLAASGEAWCCSRCRAGELGPLARSAASCRFRSLYTCVVQGKAAARVVVGG